MATIVQHNLRIVYGSLLSNGIGLGSVLLEQEAWQPYVGYVTKVKALQWLRSFIWGAAFPTSNCHSDSPGFSKTIYAYPSSPGLNYKFGVSRGVISERVIQELVYTERLQANLQRRLQPSYPPLLIQSYAWDGEVYTAAGEVIRPKPTIFLRSKGFDIDGEVYGTLITTYRVYRHTYVVNIQPSTQYAEKKFQSFFYAVWFGGTAFLEIETPMDAEDKDKVECKNRLADGTGVLSPFGVVAIGDTDIGSEFDVEEDEQERYQRQVQPEDENQYIDYCDQVQPQ